MKQPIEVQTQVIYRDSVILKDNLADAKADITALTSTYIVCVAEALVEKEEEEKE